MLTSKLAYGAPYGAKALRAIRWVEGRFTHRGLGAFLDSHLLPVESTPEAVAVVRALGVIRLGPDLQGRLARDRELEEGEPDEWALRDAAIDGFATLLGALEGRPGWTAAVLLQVLRADCGVPPHRCETARY